MLLPDYTCPSPPSGKRSSVSYSRGSIQGLIVKYEELTHRRNFNLLHAQLMDIDQGMETLERLQPKYWALLVLRKHGLTEREIAHLMGRSPALMHRHLERAILLLTQIINTGRRR